MGTSTSRSCAGPTRALDTDSQRMLAGLKARDSGAIRELHELLMHATRYEARRRAAAIGLDNRQLVADLAEQAAADAAVLILGKLESFEGRSRFTTWAWKFGIHTAGVAVRREAWRGREVPTTDGTLDALAARLSQDTGEAVQQREFLGAVTEAIGRLSERQREVLLSLVVEGVPIDVLAERRDTTRGALYKMLHDARRALRRDLQASGLLAGEGGTTR